VELTCPAVVTQAFPEFEHFSLIGLGERLHRGKPGNEALEIRDDRRHGGLNQHHLREENPIRIAPSAPG
jgi:hypothetical protein